MSNTANRFRRWMWWLLRPPKAWFIAGAALGFILPCLVLFLRTAALNYLPPVALLLLWPTFAILHLAIWDTMRIATTSTTAITLALLLVSLASNSVLYGISAALLRARCIGLILLMSGLAWLWWPPSDAALVNNFREHRSDLEQLVNVVRQDTSILDTACIQPSSVAEGTSRSASVIRCEEYRRLLREAGVDIIRRRTEEQFFLIVYRSEPLERISSYRGYVYCGLRGPIEWPCNLPKDVFETSTVRVKRLDSNWFIFDAFRKYSLD